MVCSGRVKPKDFAGWRGLFALLWLLPGLLLVSPAARAADPICAQVKIEIKQELTLERQAFDAMMKINNGLDTTAIENVNVDVLFTDEDGNGVLATSNPNDTSAKFFIRIDSMDGISDVSGSGTVAPSSTAEIHWLIIPAPGAAADVPTGKLYYVGAKLSYTLAGKPESVEVTPDFITVKPLPLLTLDYFLTQDVVADDPFTPEIEPSEPYTLGVRIRNNGIAPAHDVKIDSAQPKIIENAQGLLIGFKIISSFVDDQPAAPTLLIDFGTVDAKSSRVGRWQMTSTLAGQFVDFTATFTHSDELGGAVTSILEGTYAHLLVHDVLVDLPGRDLVSDFLARDGNTYRVYESDSIDTAVTDISASASFPLNSANGTEVFHTLTTSVTPGFTFVRLPDPYQGSKVIKAVTRSDGKVINLANAWTSKSRNRDTNSWNYYVNFFDVDTSGTYIVHMGDPALGPLPPNLQFIPDKVTYEGNQVGFLIESTDPNGQIPTLSVAPLPSGAVFTDNGNGSATFNWTPAVGQAGVYALIFKASDGTLTKTQSMTITVNPDWDTDGDGMDDAWEIQHFGDLSRDGKGDFDGDGVSDLDEYLAGTDPTVGTGPNPPSLSSPLFGTQVTSLTPDLVINNSVHDVATAVTYDFELYSDAAMTQLVASNTGTVEGTGTTTWTVPSALNDNTTYYWRVRALESGLYSLWVKGQFFVNTANDPPGAFSLSSPVSGEVGVAMPELSVVNSVDPDGDKLTYRFEVYTDAALTTLAKATSNILPGRAGTTSWIVSTPLQENTQYYWRAFAVDPQGAETVSTEVGQFYVNVANDPPSTPVVLAPEPGSQVTTATVDLVVSNAVDPEGASVSYNFEFDTVSSFDSPAKQTYGPVPSGASDTRWTVSGLVENTRYYWRVIATDGTASTPWVQSSLVYNTTNNPPTAPTISNPGNLAWVATQRPALSANPASDPDNDPVSYRFELYADVGMSQLLDSHLSSTTDWQLITALSNNVWYYWRVRAEDDKGGFSAWSDLYAFFVDDNGINDAPTISLLEPADAVTPTNNQVTIRWDDTDPDSNANIALYYDTDNTGADGTLIVDGLKEDPDGNGDIYTWDTSSMPTGTYYLYAVISDEASTVTQYATGTVSIVPSTVDVTGQVGVVMNKALLDLDRRVYVSTVDVSNSSGATVSGPLRIVITSSNLAPLNADGTTDDGFPYYILQADPAGLADGATLSRAIDFTYARLNLVYTVRIEQY